jgi:hypothetical protein
MLGVKCVLCSACLALALLVPSGCGSNAPDNGGSSSNSSSGLPADARMVDLTDAQKAQFCDWAVAKLGGYGHTCAADWSFMTYPDQAACVEDAPSGATTPNCQGLVGQGEACVNSIKVCTTFEELKASALCEPLTKC